MEKQLQKGIIIGFSISLIAIFIIVVTVGFYRLMRPTIVAPNISINDGTSMTADDETVFAEENELLKNLQTSLNIPSPITHQQLKWQEGVGEFIFLSKNITINGLGFVYVDNNTDPIDDTIRGYFTAQVFDNATEAPFYAAGDWFKKGNMICNTYYTGMENENMPQGGYKAPWTHIVKCGIFKEN